MKCFDALRPGAFFPPAKETETLWCVWAPSRGSQAAVAAAARRFGRAAPSSERSTRPRQNERTCLEATDSGQHQGNLHGAARKEMAKWDGNSPTRPFRIRRAKISTEGDRTSLLAWVSWRTTTRLESVFFEFFSRGF